MKFILIIECWFFSSREQQRKAEGQVRTVTEPTKLFVGTSATGFGDVQRQAMELFGTGPDELVWGCRILAKLFR